VAMTRKERAKVKAEAARLLAQAERVWAQRAADKARPVPFAEKAATVGMAMVDNRPGVTYAGHRLPVSHSLPLMPDKGFTTATEYGQSIRVYKDGTRADSRGRRIMASEADVSRAKKAGFVRDNNA
jgi:hypothetical protein